MVFNFESKDWLSNKRASGGQMKVNHGPTPSPYSKSETEEKKFNKKIYHIFSSKSHNLTNLHGFMVKSIFCYLGIPLS